MKKLCEPCVKRRMAEGLPEVFARGWVFNPSYAECEGCRALNEKPMPEGEK